MKYLEKEINRLRNLRQNKDISEEEIEQLAKANIERQEILSSLTFCIDEVEKKFAQNLLEKYLSESSLESTAERDTLRQLIDVEVLIERIKKFLKTEYAKSNPAIPTQMLDQLTNLNNQLLELKEKLGLTKKEENKNILEEWNKLKNKALAYYKENSGCNVIKCPECKKLFMILKDVRQYTAQKIPFFKRTMLYNKKLFELYEQNRVTIEEMAVILGVSNDYITYIFDNIYKNDTKNN